MPRIRAIVIWSALLLAAAIPVIAAGQSPLLAWRSPIYIAAGFAGVIGLVLILLQSLLIGGYLPGLSQNRRLHRLAGILLVVMVIVHVAGLWITSPPDVIDALTFTSPTPFSDWGVIAMWMVFLAAVLGALRRRWPWRLRSWRLAHTGAVLVVVTGTVVHALLIQGTMETVSKSLLCLVAVIALAKVIADRRVWTSGMRRRR
ncbi:ferric reductase like transmembrane component [Roseovarius sp. A-2]|uniref:ferric reductase-like transmembrane domain-containing protein n=1 Tax=Roseovarius sp. A-2 TaxID=1570360 RepID=UPI0009B541F6|nr:ferric reductase-like transmembrane domain-containing protein [Roseovarius sp. A-2]GAW35801.1 ferric reductase like transmembrane component [Roseovarius sp. A-2]